LYQSDGRSGTRRVVITGLGAVTSIGSGADGLWQGVLRGKAGIRTLTRFDASLFSARIAAEVPDFDPTAFLADLDPKAVRRLDRCSQFAVSASVMAIRDAGILMAAEDPARVGVCIGSALGGAAYAEEQHTRFLESRGHACEPNVALQMFVGAGTCNTAILLGATGYSTSNADSCASGTIALGNAFRAIQRGDADVILAGGAEAPLAPLCYGAFAQIRALSTRNDAPERACRPFDRERDGFVMGEGAGVLVLEEFEHARRRGAEPYAELVGFALTNDAHHMTAPRPDAESSARCILHALADACLPPERLDYINAHGSATPLNDATETLALHRALGSAAAGIPVSGTKAMHGHALGASGAIEAAICCLAMRHAYIPPTLNLDTPDPACDLDYVPLVGREKRLDTVLSNSFGFGGINACLVLRRL
jgi:3-oxoacyl-[acyl-carrier-protein] synthase II